MDKKVIEVFTLFKRRRKKHKMRCQVIVCKLFICICKSLCVHVLHECGRSNCTSHKVDTHTVNETERISWKLKWWNYFPWGRSILWFVSVTITHCAIVTCGGVFNTKTNWCMNRGVRCKKCLSHSDKMIFIVHWNV